MKKIILFSIIAAASIFMACKPQVSHIHNYTETVVAPTCTEKGYTKYTCSCGDTYNDKEVASLGGHILSDPIIAVRPTITSKGIRASVCSRCSELINPVEEEKYDDEIDLSENGLNLYIGQYEVTRAYYKEIMGADPSAAYPCTASEGDARPVDGVDKASAAKFCNALSEKKNLVPFYNIVKEGDGDSATFTVSESSSDGHDKGYRLLTKTEWEIAAKAGTENLFSGTSGSYKDNVKSGNIPYTLKIKEDDDGGDGSLTEESGSNSYQNIGDEDLSKYAWNKYNVRTGEVENPIQSRKAWKAGDWTVYTGDNGVVYKQNKWGFAAARGGMDDSLYGTHTVGTRLPNEWDLYDMTGNVSELTEDGIAVGGDAASNPSKIYIGHSAYDPRITGFRICRNK